MTHYTNPFAINSDRYHLWQMLVERDIEAFINGDWLAISGDFLPKQFTAIDANYDPNPDNWRISFATLDDYRSSWLKQSAEMRVKVDEDNLRAGLIAATDMSQIELKGNTALLHKKFNGQITAKDGQIIDLNWQTLYQCKRVNEEWKIVGFVGYLPYGGLQSSE